MIVISESKLKVMLSADDMREYELDDMNSTQTREAFRSLMREAKNRCGFNGLEGRVFVQLYRSKAGGCELFVTKLSKADCGGESGRSTEGSRMENGAVQHLRRGDGSQDLEYRRYYDDKAAKSPHVIYRFDEMRHLLAICAVLLASRYNGSGTAYAEENRKGFYLILDRETYAAGEHFGRLCPSSFYYYINEHCRLLTPDAVQTLGKLA